METNMVRYLMLPMLEMAPIKFYSYLADKLISHSDDA